MKKILIAASVLALSMTGITAGAQTPPAATPAVTPPPAAAPAADVQQEGNFDGAFGDQTGTDAAGTTADPAGTDVAGAPEAADTPDGG